MIGQRSVETSMTRNGRLLGRGVHKRAIGVDPCGQNAHPDVVVFTRPMGWFQQGCDGAYKNGTHVDTYDLVPSPRAWTMTRANIDVFADLKVDRG